MEIQIQALGCGFTGSIRAVDLTFALRVYVNQLLIEEKSMKKVVFTLLAVISLLSTALAHEHHPPHQGILIVLGEEFAHLELVFDNTTGTLTAYSLDGEAENAVPLTQTEIVFKLTPPGGAPFDLPLRAVKNVLTGETVGNTSQFSGQSDSLKGLIKFSGTITSVTTRGQSFKDVRFAFPEGNDNDKTK